MRQVGDNVLGEKGDKRETSAKSQSTRMYLETRETSGTATSCSKSYRSPEINGTQQ